MRAVLMAGDLGAVIFGGVILRRYGRTLIVARSQVLAETIVLDLANLAQQRLIELFGRRPVVSTPVKDQQLLGLRAVPNNIVRAIQARFSRRSTVSLLYPVSLAICLMLTS